MPITGEAPKDFCKAEQVEAANSDLAPAIESVSVAAPLSRHSIGIRASSVSAPEPDSAVAPAVEETQLLAPLPGVVTIFERSIGEDVQGGDVVLVVEAMKMEILITAPLPGKVVAILCELGDKVEKGAVLAVLGQTVHAEYRSKVEKISAKTVAAHKMKTGAVAEKLRDLRERERAIKEMGGVAAVASQHNRGKLTARERIDLLFDLGTFRETDLFMQHRGTRFGIDRADIPADGVITGFGKINGRPAAAFSQDFTSRAGSLGEMHAKKICKVMDMALKAGIPFIGLNDSGGARIQEGVDSLSGFGQIFYRNSLCSGVIPQISAIMGPTAGGAVYSPAMTDWVFMVKNTSYMFITGPDVVRAVIGEEISQEDLGGAMAHNAKSGVAQFAAENDRDCLEQIRTLLSFLPSNNTEHPPRIDTGDSPDRLAPELDTIIPDSPAAAYDVQKVIRAIVDNGDFFEPHAYYAPNIVVGFARLNGHTIGIIANQPNWLAGCLDVDSSDKATRFIRFCDCFNIPMLTIADVPGYLPGSEQEWNGIIRHGAKLLWSYSEATVPKMTLITRKNYGGAYIAMCSRHLGADITLAWPTAEIAVMGAEGAANIIFRREIQEAPDPIAKRQEVIENYRKELYNPYVAASRGYIDAVVAPSETRVRLIEILETICDKRELRPRRKHGNIPL
jgi:acetyl-CoA carboxylase carboxyltransferase component/biotin carboxyl carrier protein